jgi:hypothetical protein
MSFAYDTALATKGWLMNIAVDSANGFLYAGDTDGSSPYHGFIIKVDLSSFTSVAEIDIGSKDNHEGAAVIDTVNGYAYFGTLSGSSGYIEKIRLSDFTHQGTLSLGSGYIPQVLVLDSTDGYLYCVTGNILNKKVIKIALSTFTVYDDTCTILGVVNPGAGIKIGDYIYWGCDIVGSTDGVISKMSIASLSEVATLTITGGSMPEGLAYDGTYLYVAYYSYSPYVSYVAKVNLSTLTVVATLTLSSPFDYCQTCFICDNYLYVMSLNCVLYQIRLSDFSLVTYIDKSDRIEHYSSAYDSINKKGYFSSIYDSEYGSPSQILRFSLGGVELPISSILFLDEEPIILI